MYITFPIYSLQAKILVTIFPMISQGVSGRTREDFIPLIL